MDILGTLIGRPFGWVFWAILQLINNYGIALLFFSIIVKILLYPLQYKSKKGMIAQQRLQPKIKELEARYKNDKATYQSEVQKLYTENNVNPMSGCLPMLLIFPIMIGLYKVIRQPLTYVFGLGDKITDIMNEIVAKAGATSAAATELLPMVNGESAVNEIAILRYLPETHDYYINMNFFGLDLTQNPTLALNWLIILPILSGVTAFLMSIITQKLQERMTGITATNSQGGMSTKTLLYTMPIISVVIGFSLPAGLTVYWIFNNILGILQEYLLQLQMKKIITTETEKEAMIEAARAAQREEAKQANREIQMKMNSSQKKQKSGSQKSSSQKKYKLSRPVRRDDDDDDD